MERARGDRRCGREVLERGRRVGKRLEAYLDWLLSTEEPEEIGLEKLDELEREAAEEGLDPPDRAAIVASWRDLGWPGPMEPLHERLLAFARAELVLGQAFVHGPAGPLVRWPYGSWLLVRHRASIARYLNHCRREAEVAQRYREERAP